MHNGELVRATAMLVMLGACSDPGQAEHEPATTSMSSAALAPAHDPLACTLGAECARWGALIEDASLPPDECPPPGGGLREVVWHASIDAVPCTFGSCGLLDVQLAAEPDGDLLALSRVELSSTLPRGREAGLWLERYTAAGASAGGALVDFAIPPPGVEVQRHPSLLLDQSGEPVLAMARAVLPGDAPRPLTVAAIAGRRAPALKTAAVSTPASRATLTAIGPRGELLVASVHRTSDQPTDPSEIPWDAVFHPFYPQRAALSLHDRHGRLLWNRPWAEGDASTEISAVHIDRSGRITVLVAIDRGPLQGSVVARLDRAGRVIWQRPVADPTFAVKLALDPQGNAYVMSTRWLDSFELRLERIDPDGQSAAAWTLPFFGFGFGVGFHAGAGRAWLTTFGGDGPGVELLAVPFEPDGETCEVQRYAWPQAWEEFVDDRVALAESETSGLYLATNRTIAKLAGGVP